MPDKLTVREVVALSLQVFGGDQPSDAFGASTGVKAACVALAESDGNPAAVNPTYVDGGCRGPGSHHATGLWQIIPACHPDFPEADLKTATGSAKAAHRISKGGTDWSAWSTGHSGSKKNGTYNPNKGAWTAKKPQVATALAQLQEEENSGGPGFAGTLAEAVKRGVLGPIGSEVVDRLPNPVEAAGGVVDAAQAAVEAARTLRELGAFLTDPDNWRRLLTVAMGLGLIGIGAMFIFRDDIARGALAYATGGGSEAARPDSGGSPDGPTQQAV